MNGYSSTSIGKTGANDLTLSVNRSDAELETPPEQFRGCFLFPHAWSDMMNQLEVIILKIKIGGV